ncbi:MAG: hypothetical protein KKC68_06970 [Candidatus Thermoplasmatota archaeon]|nr:hypothetical protein [Candidatus Thermoplasmatota archaeon]
MISFSVFNLAFAFLLTCLALIVSLSVVNILGGVLIIVVGIPLYVFFSPKTDIHHLKSLFLSEEAIFVRRIGQRERFLANFIQLMHRGYKRFRKRGD